MTLSLSGTPFLQTLQIKSIPDEHRDSVVKHVVFVHKSVGDYSVQFQQKLRRNNYVTPKNYLDFINTYLKLLDDKDEYILSQVRSLTFLASTKSLEPSV